MACLWHRGEWTLREWCRSSRHSGPTDTQRLCPSTTPVWWASEQYDLLLHMFPIGSGPPRTRGSQSTGYLNQAAEALTNAADPHFLYSEVPTYLEGSIFAPHQHSIDAGNRRLRVLRSSVLYSALAAESFANELLRDLLDPAEAEAVDRLPTPEKLLLGPRMANIPPPLSRGSEPAQTVFKLFAVRNALVHPRPGGYSTLIQDVGERDERDLGPTAAGRYLLKVAEVIVLLNPLRPEPPLIGEAAILIQCPHVVRQFIASTGDRITTVVAEDAAVPVGLFEAASRNAAKRARRASQIAPTRAGAGRAQQKP
jgi:hypothetical protein